MSQTLDISSRSVYNIFDVVSDWGGVQGSLLLLVSTLSALFSSILGSVQKAEALYQVSPENYSNHHKLRSRNKKHESGSNETASSLVTPH